MTRDNRGLASADPETRERVARMGGEARAGDPQGLAEAGRKGGEAVVQKYGPEHMAEIGRRGGESSRRGAKRMRREGVEGENPGSVPQNDSGANPQE
ncbi:MAG: KGG domain-containing protein [Nitrososphaera sp.]|uniref:KGG domain-containing protein n=1 Tax=Nitrososphaera sp. TaxID=1971748 RepID=UPI003D6F2380